MAKQDSPALDGEIARLFALPLGELTLARNKLAVRLRKEGDREETRAATWRQSPE